MLSRPRGSRLPVLPSVLVPRLQDTWDLGLPLKISEQWVWAPKLLCTEGLDQLLRNPQLEVDSCMELHLEEDHCLEQPQPQAVAPFQLDLALSEPWEV